MSFRPVDQELFPGILNALFSSLSGSGREEDKCRLIPQSVAAGARVPGFKSSSATFQVRDYLRASHVTCQTLGSLICKMGQK